MKKRLAREVEALKEQSCGESLRADVPKAIKELTLWATDNLINDKSLEFRLESMIVGSERSYFLWQETFLAFANMAEISSMHLQMYIRFLYGMLKATRMENMVAFMDPSDVSHGCFKPAEKPNRIAARLKHLQHKQILLIPYNPGKHWVLTIVNRAADTVYWMDPNKRRLAPGPWKRELDEGIKMYYMESGVRQGMRGTQWINLGNIPPQHTGTDCGYFVMRYMRDIVRDTTLNFVSKWSHKESRNSMVYTQEDIDEVREEWAEYVLRGYVKVGKRT